MVEEKVQKDQRKKPQKKSLPRISSQANLVDIPGSKIVEENILYGL
jgi:hypothetical protein